MTKLLRLTAPAKLNLMLQITGRRDDGYHLLQTVFQFIDLCDRLEFEATDDGRIERRRSNSPVPETDDILLATARLLQSRHDVSQGVGIGIEKAVSGAGGLSSGVQNGSKSPRIVTRFVALMKALEAKRSVPQGRAYISPGHRPGWTNQRRIPALKGRC